MSGEAIFGDNCASYISCISEFMCIITNFFESLSSNVYYLKFI